MIALTPNQKRLAIGAAVLLLLIITNPSINSFKAYRGSNTYQGLKRPVNLFICSVYEHRGERYLGFLGNFVGITWHEKKERVATNVGIIPANDSKYKLWLKLNQSGYYTKNYSSFEIQFSDNSSIRRLYTTLHEAHFYTKSEKDFIDQFFN